MTLRMNTENLGPDYRQWPIEVQLKLRDYLKGILGAEKSETRRILVNKTKQRIRFENETESEVTIVVENKDSNG